MKGLRQTAKKIYEALERTFWKVGLYVFGPLFLAGLGALALEWFGAEQGTQQGSIVLLLVAIALNLLFLRKTRFGREFSGLLIGEEYAARPLFFRTRSFLKSVAECVRSNAGYSLAVSLAFVMLVIAQGNLPYGYYTLLRVVVCAVAGYGAFRAFEGERMAWTWIMAATAFIFNPLIPLHMDRETWAFADLVTALLLPASIKGLHSPAKGQTLPMHDYSRGKTAPSTTYRIEEKAIHCEEDEDIDYVVLNDDGNPIPDPLRNRSASDSDFSRWVAKFNAEHLYRQGSTKNDLDKE